MSNLQFLDIINIVTPLIGGAIGWFVGRRKQKNDFLNDLQASIDLLAEKNRDLYKEVITLRSESSKLQIKVEDLTHENEKLRINIEYLSSKLEGVKTITRKIQANETD